ncbi:MAG: acylneuraminate cytidylyltransferase family protein [Anaerolineales bacterium]|nr:acylneuraminate cytidylyltransferase family protein [Anaerolineales bacterium]
MTQTSKPKIAALVPMRHNSERVPGKNYRPLAGQPLFHHIITSLQACPEINAIVVDTDSPAVLEGLTIHFPEVKRLERPEHLRAGEIPMNDILLYDTTQVDADIFVQTHSTNPLLQPETISGAIKAYLDAPPEKDSLFSVTKLQTRLYDRDGKAINHNPAELLRTQDLPPIYEENSCIYIFTRDTLETFGHRIGKNPLMFEIDATEAWDIDEELDFLIADIIKRQENRKCLPENETY